MFVIPLILIQIGDDWLVIERFLTYGSIPENAS